MEQIDETPDDSDLIAARHVRTLVYRENINAVEEVRETFRRQGAQVGPALVLTSRDVRVHSIIGGEIGERMTGTSHVAVSLGAAMGEFNVAMREAESRFRALSLALADIEKIKTPPPPSPRLVRKIVL